MPTSESTLRHISYYDWSHAPSLWLSQHGYPLYSPNGPILPTSNPTEFASHQHYIQVMEAQGNPVPGTPPHPTTPGTVQMPQWGVTAAPVLAQTTPKKTKSDDKNKFYNIPIFTVFRGKYKDKVEGEIGLEIECEGMNLFTAPISWWITHPDGSLRAYKEHQPIEYVLRKPVSREDVPKALDYLAKKLKQAGSHIHESHRTSVHVHVNCQDLTIKQIYQYWCMYTVFEEILVAFSGPDRPGNLFCLSSKQAEYQIKVLEDSIRTENFQELFSDNLRYTSCNTASLGKFGSLEFRSMRGTVDQDLIQMWVDLLLILKDKALEYDNPREIVEDFQSLNSEGFLNKVFGKRGDILAMFKSRPDRHKLLWDGLRLMRDVAMSIEWETRYVSNEAKKKRRSLMKKSILQ